MDDDIDALINIGSVNLSAVVTQRAAAQRAQSQQIADSARENTQQGKDKKDKRDKRDKKDKKSSRRDRDEVSQPPPPADSGEWTCAVCTLVNDPSSDRCGACDNRRGSRMCTAGCKKMVSHKHKNDSKCPHCRVALPAPTQRQRQREVVIIDDDEDAAGGDPFAASAAAAASAATADGGRKTDKKSKKDSSDEITSVFPVEGRVSLDEDDVLLLGEEGARKAADSRNNSSKQMPVEQDAGGGDKSADGAAQVEIDGADVDGDLSESSDEDYSSDDDSTTSSSSSDDDDDDDDDAQQNRVSQGTVNDQNRLRTLLQELSNACAHEDIQPADPPASMAVRGNLKPFQRQALAWMLQREHHEDNMRRFYGKRYNSMLQQQQQQQQQQDGSQSSGSGGGSSNNGSPTGLGPNVAFGGGGGSSGRGGVISLQNPLSSQRSQMQQMGSRSNSQQQQVPVLARPSDRRVAQVREHETMNFNGGILADSMGTGKTRSLIAVCESTLQLARDSSGSAAGLGAKVLSHATVIICPMSLMANWAHEIKTVVGEKRRVLTYHGPSRHKYSALFHLAQNYDYIITTYHTVAGDIKTAALAAKKEKEKRQRQTLRAMGDDVASDDEENNGNGNNANRNQGPVSTAAAAAAAAAATTGNNTMATPKPNPKRGRPKRKRLTRKEEDELLSMPINCPWTKINFFRIILDEAHNIRNGRSALARAASRLDAMRRWAVTATPFCNRIDDFFPLARFLKVPLLSRHDVWRENVAAPLKRVVKQGGSADAKARAMAPLQMVLSGIMMRRTLDSIDPATKQPIVTLPKRTDHVIAIKLSPVERKLYDVVFQGASVRLQLLADYNPVDRGQFGGSHHKRNYGMSVQEFRRRQFATAFEMLMRCRQACSHVYIMLAALQKKAKQMQDESGVDSLDELLGLDGGSENKNNTTMTLEEAAEKMARELERRTEEHRQELRRRLEAAHGASGGHLPIYVAGVLDAVTKNNSSSVNNTSGGTISIGGFGAPAAAASAASENNSTNLTVDQSNNIKNDDETAATAAADGDDDPLSGECMICFDPVSEGDPCMLVTCCHIFCRGCLTRSVEQFKKCPHCNGAATTKDIIAVNASAAAAAAGGASSPGGSGSTGLNEEAAARKSAAEAEERRKAKEYFDTINSIRVGPTSEWPLSIKARTLSDIMDSMPDDETHVIVFSQFLQFLQYLQEAMRALGHDAALYCGAHTAKQREAILKEFDKKIPNGEAVVPARAAQGGNRSNNAGDYDDDDNDDLFSSSAATAASNSNAGAVKFDHLPPSKQPQPQRRRRKILLATVQTCGVGVNITVATRAVLLDPCWNLATEEQAISRCYRIGQLRPVNVYRFVTDSSVEEDIVKLCKEKGEWADLCLEKKRPGGGGGGGGGGVGLDDLMNMFLNKKGPEALERERAEREARRNSAGADDDDDDDDG